MSLPVFVVGRNRSGTTWLANQLCEHPDIVGVQHERHHGIHESAYFRMIDGRYGDLSERINYAEFVEVMEASDFFRLAGADKDFLYSLWPTNYERVFRAVMDRFADEHGAKAWLEKADVQEAALQKVLAAYPDARIVGIIRDPVTNTASTVAPLPSDGSAGWRPWMLLRMPLVWAYTTKVLKAFARRNDRVCLVRYEQMREDLEGTLRCVVGALGLAWDPAVLGQTYKPQSSFRSKEDRKKALSPAEKALVRVVASVGLLMPRCLLRLADRLRQWQRGRRPLPWWFFRLSPFFQDDPRQYDDVFGRPGTSPAETAVEKP